MSYSLTLNEFKAVQISKPNEMSSFFMSYHTTVTTSNDFYTALEEARKLANDIHHTISEKDQSAVFFPYR